MPADPVGRLRHTKMQTYYIIYVLIARRLRPNNAARHSGGMICRDCCKRLDTACGRFIAPLRAAGSDSHAGCATPRLYAPSALPVDTLRRRTYDLGDLGRGIRAKC